MRSPVAALPLAALLLALSASALSLKGGGEDSQPFDTAFTEIGGMCNPHPSPISDNDRKLGHGNPVCRYEPSKEELEKWRQQPADIAIIIPSNQLAAELPSKPDDAPWLSPLNYGVLTWHRYAKYHGYAFYNGMPNETEKDCPELDQRWPAWTKPCMAMQLIKRHKYLMMVDQDTTVLKPRLRLEPLFDMAGLFKKAPKKTIAVAEEWGSCSAKTGRSPRSGDINTGVVLMRASPATNEALATWYLGPTRCKGWTPSDQDKSTFNFQGWPYNCHGCGCLSRAAKEWSFDQVAFYASVANNESFKSIVKIFRSGCPINSPHADFIPHFVSGTPDGYSYTPSIKEPLIKNLQLCTSKLMDAPPGTGDPYERCSFCEALPPEWHSQVPTACPR